MAAIVSIDSIPMHYFKEENSYFGLVWEDLFTSISVCQLLPGQVQTRHYHQRPDDGNEVLLIYAGKFEVVVDEQVTMHDCSEKGPLLVAYKSLERGCIRNLDLETPVKFLNMFSPPFKEGELYFEGEHS
jgi:hypothetical protein